MALLCRKCGHTVEHDCAGSSPLATAVQSCPLTKKGVIWVNVVNLAGGSVHGVSITIDGVGETTDPVGFATSGPVPAGGKTVTLENKFEGALKQYYLCDPATRTVPVADGEVSVVEFKLPSWIEVRVEDDKGKLVDDVTVVVKDASGARTETLTKDKLDPGGFYRVETLYPGECEISFPDLCDTEWSAKK